MRRACVLAVALVSGCGGSSGTGTTDAPLAPSAAVQLPQAALVVTIQVAPVTPGSEPETHVASWTITIRETAGVAGTVNFVNTTVRDAASGAGAGPSDVVALDRDQVIAAAGTDRIEGGGSLKVPEKLQYSLLSGGQKVALTSVVQLTDDNGHIVSGSGQAQSP